MLWHHSLHKYQLHTVGDKTVFLILACTPFVVCAVLAILFLFFVQLYTNNITKLTAQLIYLIVKLLKSMHNFNIKSLVIT